MVPVNPEWGPGEGRVVDEDTGSCAAKIHAFGASVVATEKVAAAVATSAAEFAAAVAELVAVADFALRNYQQRQEWTK